MGVKSGHYSRKRNLTELVGRKKMNRTQDEFITPKWDDMVFEFTRTRVNPTNSKPDYDETNIGLLFPQNITTEIIFITAQLPHSWKLGSTISPHVHIVQSHAGQAVFKLDYKWYNIGDPVPESWTTYVMNKYADTTDYVSPRSQLIAGDGIDGTGKGISSMLKMKLYRDDDVHVGDILTDQFDIHILIDELGSRQIYQK